MPIFMRVSIAVGTSIEKAVEEMLGAAVATGCIIESEIDGVPFSVFPGAAAAEIVRMYRDKRTLFDRWAREGRKLHRESDEHG
jgi:hypothetical protein